MNAWKQPAVKRARRIVLFAAIAGCLVYFVPVVGVVFLVCGVLDVSRHNKITLVLLEKYFMGNGILTWLLSPLNLIADLFSHRNKGVYRLEDLPAEHRAEIQSCVRAFVDNGDAIKAHIAATLAQNKRGMLTFKWFNAPQTTDLRIAAFERNYRYIRTIAISVFNRRESTSWHFGPMRLTFRVLYNLDPIDSRDVRIEVDDRVHYWVDEPLFIFDDTMFHRSINNADNVRYCLFMDIIRPNYARPAFDACVSAASAISGSFKRLFYKNWSFLR